MNNNNNKNNNHNNTTTTSNNNNNLTRQPRRYNINSIKGNNIQNNNHYSAPVNSKEPQKFEEPINNNVENNIEQPLNNTDQNNIEEQFNNIENDGQNVDLNNSYNNNSRVRDNVNKKKGNSNNSLANVINNKLSNLKNNNKKKKDEDNQDEKNAKTTKDNKAKDAAGKLASAVGAANELKDGVEEAKEEANNVIEQQSKIVKERTKQAAKKKIRAFLIQKVLVPALPFIGLLLVLVLIVLIVVSVAERMGDDVNAITNINLNYCDNVKVEWEEIVEQIPVKMEKTVTNKEYLVYQMALTDYREIDSEEVLKALAIIYRTNLYYNSNNMASNTCEFELDQPYFDAIEEEENSVFVKALDDTYNKVFTVDKMKLSELKIDDNFTYTGVESTYYGDAYVLSQDKLHYLKDWVDSHVDGNHKVNGSVEENTFSPWAAWYLVDKQENNFHDILYHFYDTKAMIGDIYNVIKYGSPEDHYGSSFCSDISLTETSLTREEFINYVMSNVNNGAFKSNAGKIYDISIANNFNPEMVVIRAVNEGFSPGGSSNNYWGIRCYNGASADDCKQFPSFDAGVLEYINNIKGNNYATAYQMMMKYSYIGDFWYNPGGSGLGGCYYFPHIRDNLSEERANEVEAACQAGKTCNKNGIGDCLATTDEDQSAYAKWQVSKMSSTRESVFNIGKDECTEEGNPEVTGDLNTLGARVAQYAVATYDSWSYSQDNRHQDGYVDCSSMVSRAYAHFSYKIYDSSDTSGEIYRWCEKNGKTINSSDLQAGDLIFYSGGAYSNSDNYRSIGHVSMYIGGDQIFAAHGQWKDKEKGIKKEQKDQVSVTSYGHNGTYFCRPAK